MTGKSGEDDKPKQQGFRGLFGFLGSGKESEENADEKVKEFVSDHDHLLDDEKRMIHEILDLGDMSASEIMTPRVDMIMAEDDETIRQVVERMIGTGFSRLPMYHEDADGIVGIIHYKDLMRPILEGHADEPARPYCYDAMFVPETKDVFPLLTEMQTNRQQMAIVVDEYGGTDGLITVEDIVEEIVGEIVDETDREQPVIKREDEKTWLASGGFPVEDAISLGWPLEESDDYETVAGWMLSKFDTVPQTGDFLDVSGWRFTIHEMRRRRIVSIRVERLSGGSNALARDEKETTQEDQ